MGFYSKTKRKLVEMFSVIHQIITQYLDEYLVLTLQKLNPMRTVIDSVSNITSNSDSFD